jgi:hypothetical protein
LTILPEKRGFYEGSLSVITADLPRGKQGKKVLSGLERFFRSAKPRRFIDLTAIPAQNQRRLQLTAARPPSPDIYQPSG